MKNQSVLLTMWVLMAVATAALQGCGTKNETREARPVRVKTMIVGGEIAAKSRTFSGTVEEETRTSLSFATLGTVERMEVSEGQLVRKGQLIGVLDPTAARNSHEMALATKEQALDAQRRMEELHEAGSLPEIKWVEVQTQVRQAVAAEQLARKALDDTKLYSPVSGYVAQRKVEAGANVAPGLTVAVVMGIDRVKVRVAVPEGEIAQVRKGQEVTVTATAAGGKRLKGRVTEKGVSADPLSRCYEVRAEVTNGDHALLPGMIVEAAFAEDAAGEAESETVVAVPANIIQLAADNRTFVWRVMDGVAERAFVETGENLGDRVAIVGGLTAGDKIIVSGQQKVSSGMKIEEVL